jgi:hypothetical protein
MHIERKPPQKQIRCPYSEADSRAEYWSKPGPAYSNAYRVMFRPVRLFKATGPIAEPYWPFRRNFEDGMREFLVRSLQPADEWDIWCFSRKREKAYILRPPYGNEILHFATGPVSCVLVADIGGGRHLRRGFNKTCDFDPLNREHVTRAEQLANIYGRERMTFADAAHRARREETPEDISAHIGLKRIWIPESMTACEPSEKQRPGSANFPADNHNSNMEKPHVFTSNNTKNPIY